MGQFFSDLMEDFANKIQLNAAIQELIDSGGASDDARRTVYEFGASLAAISRVSGSMEM